VDINQCAMNVKNIMKVEIKLKDVQYVKDKENLLKSLKIDLI